MKISGSPWNQALPVELNTASSPHSPSGSVSIPNEPHLQQTEQAAHVGQRTSPRPSLSTQRRFSTQAQSENVSRTPHRASADDRAKASLQTLPLELKQHIVGRVLDGPLTLSKARGVLSSMQATRVMQGAVLGHGALCSRLETMVHYAKRLREIASRADVQLDLNGLTGKEVDDLLKLCTAAQRRRLMPNVTTQKAHQIAEKIWTLGSGLKRLTPEQRATLMATALDLEDEDDQQLALAGMAKGLLHLGEAEQDALFSLALNDPDPAQEEGILRAICSDFSNLRTEQQQQILNHLPDLSLDAQFNVLVTLSGHLPALNPDLRGRLVDVLGVGHGNAYQRHLNLELIRAQLLDQLDSLDGPQQMALIGHLSRIVDEEQQAVAFGHIASKLDQLEPDARDELASALGEALEALDGDELQSHMLSGLCASLQHLPSDQPGELVQLAVNMADGTGTKGRLLGALGGAFVHLTRDERDEVFAETLDKTSGLDRRLALNGLARGAPAMKSGQITDLLKAMGALNDNSTAYAIEGFAPNIHVLNGDQRSTLLDLVEGLSPARKSEALAALGGSLMSDQAK